MLQTFLPYFLWALISGHPSAPDSPTTVQLTAPQITKDSLILIRKHIEKRLLEYRKSAQPEKCYVQTDRTLYQPGDSIGFTAFLRNAADLKPSATSQILYVKLFGPGGVFRHEHALYVAEGSATGEFLLDNKWPGGIYTIKAWTKWMGNTRDTFVKNITVHKTNFSNSNILFEFEKKAYGPGDEVEAKIGLQRLYNEPSDFQQITFTADTAGRQFIQGETCANAQGTAVIRFRLPQNLSSGDGLLHVQVMYKGRPEAISRAIPIVLNKINLAFFPEGGDAVAGLPCRMAFKAVNEYGKPADVQGFITNQQGETVARFSSFHNGMGAFDFTPLAKCQYTATITRPFLSKEPINLPAIMDAGATIQLIENTGKALTVRVLSTKKQNVYLAGVAQDSLFFCKELNVPGQGSLVNIPIETLPAGIVRLTLFNELLEEQAERLVFVNRDKKLQVEITTDKSKYFPREKVSLELKVTDHQARPVAGRFSMAVVDESNLIFADDKQGNILASLLLEQDVKGRIEEPNFYFNEDEPKSSQALDYLLMTQGWRRFEWKEKQVKYSYIPEKAGFSGYVVDKNRKPCINKEVRLLPGGPTTLTDVNGYFMFEGVDIQAYQLAETGNVQIPVTDKYDPYNFFHEDKKEKTGSSPGPTFLVGKIFDPSPDVGILIGASIKVLKGTTFVGGGISDVNGEFRIRVDGGLYNIEVSYTGYPTKRINGVYVAGGEFNRLNIEMRSNLELREVEIKEYRVPLIDPDDVMTYLRPDIHPVKTTAPKAKSSASANKSDKGKAVKTSLFSPLESGDFTTIAEGQDKNPVLRIRKSRKKRTEPYVQFIVEMTPRMRSRQFYMPQYLPTDTSYYDPATLYWNPVIVTDKEGKAAVSFHTSDAVTNFRITVEGIGKGGSAGRGEQHFHTEKALVLDAKIPSYAVAGDTLLLQAALTNNSDKALSGTFMSTASSSLQCIMPGDNPLTIRPGETKIVPVQILAQNPVKGTLPTIDMTFSGTDGQREKLTGCLTLQEKGVPVQQVIGNGGKSSEFNLELTDPVPNSVAVKLNVYPSVLSDLLNNMKRMVLQPYGCFEQISSAIYPNLFVLDLLNSTGQTDVQTETEAKRHLAEGYKQLIGHRAGNEGFDWFSNHTGNEVLTAYAVLELTQMKKVIDVDQGLIDGSLAWLKKRTDGDGGWQFNKVREDWDVSEGVDAYIVWALSEAGYAQQFMPEVEAAYKKAVSSGDLYQTALMANTMLNLKDPRSAKLVKILAARQNTNGGWSGQTASAFNSDNSHLLIETTSLAVLALMKASKPVNNAIYFLAGYKNAFGLGNTQSTMLALMAFVEYGKNHPEKQVNSSFTVMVDGQVVDKKFFRKGTPDKFTIDGLEQYFTNNKPRIKVLFDDENRTVPYDLEMSYCRYSLNTQVESRLAFETKLLKTEAKAGETIRMSATLSNTTKTSLASPMMVLAIPAGLSVQPWQLKQLLDEKQCDYYEIMNHQIVFYFRGIAAGETRTINLDLRADIPGSYESPASQAYLYYSNNQRVWSRPERVKIGGLLVSGF